MKVSNNPYENVDWSAYDQLKDVIHVHFDRGGSRYDIAIQDKIQEYLDRGFEAFCPSDKETPDYDVSETLEIAWPPTDWADLYDGWENMDPSSEGWWGCPGCEYDHHSFNDAGIEHVVQMFSEINGNDFDTDPQDRFDIAERIVDDGGIAYYPHPLIQDYGRESADEFDVYIPEFQDLWPDLFGIAVYGVGNKDDDGQSSIDGEGERGWDVILDETEPEGPHVWGVSEDDGQFAGDDDDWRGGADIRWNTVLVEDKQALDHLEPPELKEAYRTGQFYFSYRTDWDIEPPVINSIQVDDCERTITLDVDKYDSIEWVYADEVQDTGPTFDYSGTLNIGYIRARIDYANANGESGTLTQQFSMTIDPSEALGSGATVGVIDTGLNVHETTNQRPDGDGGEEWNVVGGKNFLTGEEIDLETEDFDAIEDPNGHGTFVASEIAHVDEGVAPEADLLIAKALDEDGQGGTDGILDAITWCGEQGADVLCMSLGTPLYSEAMAKEVEHALEEQGVKAVCVAVGNDRYATRWVNSPSDTTDYAIGVAATNGADPEDAKPAYFSNVGPDDGATDFSNGETRGAKPWVAAPGMKIEAQVAKTDGSLTRKELTGTSMAAPVVAGSIARLVGYAPELDYSEVRDRVARTAEPIPNAATTEVGHGMINVSNLLNDAEPDSDQTEAMDTAPAARAATHRGLGGGWF